MFKHRHIPELHGIESRVKTEMTPAGRIYSFDGKARQYPSITTVLGRQPNPWLHEWRKRVGEETANKISRQASMNGTKFHELMASLIQNKECNLTGLMPNLTCSYHSMKALLEQNLQEVFASEVPLYSDYLRVAGRVDLVGIWNGKISVIDFKTSRRHKTREDCIGYFHQESAYAIMFEELTTIPVPQLVTLMTVEGDTKPLVFVEKRNTWQDEMIEIIDEYR